MKKKILSVILAALMLLTVSVPAFAAEDASPATGDTLQFGADGKFKILVLADVQDDNPVNEDTLQYIREALDQEKPDIVVFNGDNITIDDKAAYDQLLTPLVERGQKFTFVFGNHDFEDRSFSPEDMLEIFQSYEGCLAYDADPSLHGCATHNLPVLSSDGTKVAFNLWMFDSGDYIRDENGEYVKDAQDSRIYDCVRKDQIEWYKNESKKLEEANGGKVPSIAFQHIITEEGVAAILPKMPSFLGFLGRSFNNGNAYSFVPVFTRIKDGFIFEPPCPSTDNEGQWDAFVERGDVLGCVFGHDHVNSFIAEYNGVDAIMTPGITSESYNDPMLRGGRIITIDEKDPWKYETKMLHFHALALKEGSLLPEVTGQSIASFRLQEFLLGISEVALKLGQVLTFFVR